MSGERFRDPDDRLMAHLAEVAEAVDPAPPELVDMAMAAYDLDAIDAELADLVSDSALAGTAGVRALAADVRSLAFGSASATIEFDVETSGQVVGLVSPSATRAWLHQGAYESELALDAYGGFQAGLRGSGPFRIVAEMEDRRRVVTGWVLP